MPASDSPCTWHLRHSGAQAAANPDDSVVARPGCSAGVVGATEVDVNEVGVNQAGANKAGINGSSRLTV